MFTTSSSLLLVTPWHTVARGRLPTASTFFALMLLNPKEAAFFPVPFVLVARSRVWSGGGLVITAATAGLVTGSGLGVDVNGDHGICFVVSCRSGDDVGSSGAVDVDRIAGASVIGRVAGNDVTIGAGRKSGVESPVHDAVFVVEGNESAIPAGKSDLIVAVVPPIGHSFHPGCVSPGDHIPDLAPSMLADPVIGAASIAFDRHVLDAAIAVGWRSHPVVASSYSTGVSVRAHNFWESVRESHHESVCDLVSRRFSVSDDGSSTSMTTLVIVIVDKDPSIVGSQHSPGRAEALEVLELVLSSAHLAHENSVFELGDTSIAHVFSLLNRLSSHIDHFLIDE